MAFDLSSVTTSDWIQIAVAAASAGAAGASAYFASKIYELTQRQLGVSNRQADISARQAEIAAQQTAITESMAEQAQRVFILSNRPRLIIDSLKFANADPNQFVSLNIPTIQVEVLNVGGTPAEIEGSGCCYVFQREGLPPHPAYINNNEHPLFDLAVGQSIQPGQTALTYYPDQEMRVNLRLPQSVLSEDMANEFNRSSGPSNFFAIGWISYRDDAGISRKSRFARQWDGGQRRFVVVNDPDFEREA